MSKQTLNPHGVVPARQARSRATTERLVEAAVSLLAAKRFDDVTVAEIAARAGVSGDGTAGPVDVFSGLDDAVEV